MKKLTFTIALLLGSASAFAVTNQTGVYVGALGGWSFAESPTTSHVTINGSPATQDQKRNYTAGGTVGYQYAFNQNFAAGLEGSYMYFGFNKYDNNAGASGKFTNSGWQVMAVGNFLATNGFNAFVKGGAINEKTVVSASSGGVSANLATQSLWVPAVAAGIGYMPTQNLNIALQYEHTFGDNWNSSNLGSNPKPISQNAVTLGLTYLFGT